MTNSTTLTQVLVDALYASLLAGDSHYAHWDREGTAGANCPACRARRDANDRAYDALRQAKAAGVIPTGAIELLEAQ